MNALHPEPDIGSPKEKRPLASKALPSTELPEALQRRRATSRPLTLAEAQAITESIVGAVEWRGADGYCACPGAAKHTTGATPLDLHVVCEPIGPLAPGVYCFHDSCSVEVAGASFELRSALGKRSPSAAPRVRSPFIMPTRPAPAIFDPAKLESIARKLVGTDAELFAARSPKRPDNRTPASFLHELYLPGEKVVVFDLFESQGQALWTHKLPPFNACELDSFRAGKLCGVWFLANPVSGEYADTGTMNKDGTPHLSRRSWRTVAAWRYLVLESDKANPAHWLAALAQMPLPISAIYSSGGTSIHALVRLDAESKAHCDAEAAKLKPALVMLGADQKAISAVRLTRLPMCERLGKMDKGGNYVRFSEPRMQRLIYLNGTPDGTPICEQEVI